MTRSFYTTKFAVDLVLLRKSWHFIVLNLLVWVPTIVLGVLQPLFVLISVSCNYVQRSGLLHAVGEKVYNSGTNFCYLFVRWFGRVKLPSSHTLLRRTLVTEVTFSNPASNILILIEFKSSGRL